ncbi:MAG: M20 family metallopeptidase [Anaerolineae bacterium]
MKQLLNYLQSRQDAMTELAREIVTIESPTPHKAGVDAVGAVIARELAALGATVSYDRQTKTGDHVLGVINAGGGSPISMICHMDTVHPVGSTAGPMPVKIEDGKLWGPGVFDMKASSVITLNAIRALQATGLMPKHEIRMLFTSDEEMGSTTSRELIEGTAQGNALVMVMEPALSDGRLKSSRKGVGDWKITAHGKAAHAGAEHAKGVNAIHELARQIETIQDWTDYARGVTFNVGWITGGGAVNVVPDKAEMLVDCRCERLSDAEWTAAQFKTLKASLPGASIEVEGEWNRPPMECNAQRLEIIKRIQAIGAELGMKVEHGASGGGSDASFTAGMGIPTMDGFGAVGDGLHAKFEHIVLSSLPERAALSAAVLAGW